MRSFVCMSHGYIKTIQNGEHLFYVIHNSSIGIQVDSLKWRAQIRKFDPIFNNNTWS